MSIDRIDRQAIEQIVRLEANYQNLLKNFHIEVDQCKIRDANRAKEIDQLSLEVDSLKKKLTTSAIVWATICATIGTLFAGGIYAIDKALEWGRAFKGIDK